MTTSLHVRSDEKLIIGKKQLQKKKTSWTEAQLQRFKR